MLQKYLYMLYFDTGLLLVICSYFHSTRYLKSSFSLFLQVQTTDSLVKMIQAMGDMLMFLSTLLYLIYSSNRAISHKIGFELLFTISNLEFETHKKLSLGHFFACRESLDPFGYVTNYKIDICFNSMKSCFLYK